MPDNKLPIIANYCNILNLSVTKIRFLNIIVKKVFENPILLQYFILILTYILSNFSDE